MSNASQRWPRLPRRPQASTVLMDLALQGCAGRLSCRRPREAPRTRRRGAGRWGTAVQCVSLSDVATAPRRICGLPLAFQRFPLQAFHLATRASPGIGAARDGPIPTLPPGSHPRTPRESGPCTNRDGNRLREREAAGKSWTALRRLRLRPASVALSLAPRRPGSKAACSDGRCAPVADRGTDDAVGTKQTCTERIARDSAVDAPLVCRHHCAVILGTRALALGRG